MSRTCPFAVAAALCAAGCGPAPLTSRTEPTGLPRPCAILSINDTYRIEESLDHTGSMARLRTLRVRLEKEHPDLLLLHAGDFLFPSFLSRQYKGEQMIDVMNHLDGAGDAFDPRLVVVTGNHELDEDDPRFLRERIRQSQFRWLSSNIEFAAGPGGHPVIPVERLAGDVLRRCGDYQVGVFGLTIDSARPRFVAGYRDPISTARERTRDLRERGAQIVVGLTHLDIATDELLLRELGADGPDLLLGGHDHARQSRTANGRSVFKADSDAHTANVITASVGEKGVRVEHAWVYLGPDEPAPDPEVAALTAKWLEDHDRLYCGEKLGLAPGCLAEKLRVTSVDLIAEELEIRRFETNVGDLVADTALRVFEKQGAQIAVVNSGALRLNYDVAAGSQISRRQVEELFAYPMPLRLVEIDGATLQKMVNRSIEGWTGQGHFLQIAGFAFRHDPAAGKATSLTLLGPTPRRIRPDEKLRVVLNSFLLDPGKGQDGYRMIGPHDIVDDLGPDLRAGPDLKKLVLDALARPGPALVSPRPVGRICNTQRPGPCLALPE